MKKYVFIGLSGIAIVEFMVFILVGQYIGVLPIIFISVCTSIIGILLLKKQGIKIMNDIKLQLSRGQVPTDAVLDGICVIIGGILLLIPGYVTDVIGLVCLLPLTRGKVRDTIKGYIQHRVLSSYRR
ncbi:FxsA family protein [Priestia taiwanensis]|uniref:Membrane protein FxsA n=1 Tax=Priestia taiwanensis TaxID=1347902 RepID=A0A917AW24_9BACI|nr:FxsA family protein [Priestia taiwanensis]MBM7363467.1 UPF0716 protein FxsA [Priestia taiwanensis]GGE76927.1 membrane protein FxsA [Priestia taiwanensis]